MVLMKRNICLLGGLLLFTIPYNTAAKEDLGYFYNDFIQAKVGKTYSLTYGNNSFPLAIDDYVSVEATLAPRSGYDAEIENPYYCLEKVRDFSLCELSDPLTTRPSYQKAGHLYLDKEKLTSYLATLSAKLDREPENGRLKVGEDGKAVVFTESKDGCQLNVQKSYDIIMKHLLTETKTESIALAVDIKKPDVFTDNVENYGIKELIAHGESNFRGSPANRIHNIKVALEKFDGTLLKPGEELSFTSILGEVDGEHGYKEELVIKNNETIPEFGGGVCQVSTTMFRTALNGGLDITERHNHAYPVQYYAPQGTDATIYVPKPDLRFKNDTPAHILIQTRIEGTKLSIDFYGTSDGRKTELDGPRVTERTPDGKMKTSLTQRVKDAAGNIIHEETFKSFYDNPDNYHRDQLLTEKPEDWSKKQWKDYKQKHGL